MSDIIDKAVAEFLEETTRSKLVREALIEGANGSAPDAIIRRVSKEVRVSESFVQQEYWHLLNAGKLKLKGTQLWPN